MKSTWIVAVGLTIASAFAIAQPAPAPAPAPAPVPASTPPIVGVNVDPTPSFQPGLNFPPGMQPQPMQTTPPAGLPPSVQNRSSNFSTRPPTMPNGMPNGMPSAPEAQQKSEIIAVLPPAQRPPEVRAVLRTSVGDITVRLDRVNAPLTVDYFTGIAKGETDFTDIKTSKPVKRPFYNGLIFHRVVKNTLIQTGDPFGNGRGNSGRTIPDEAKPSMKFDRPGLVAMAPMRESKGTDIAKGTNSSQFFITLREMPEWNGQYTIFGEVEDGLDVVQKIANSKVGPTERPIKRIYLVAVDILESAK